MSADDDDLAAWRSNPGMASHAAAHASRAAGQSMFEHFSAGHGDSGGDPLAALLVGAAALVATHLAVSGVRRIRARAPAHVRSSSISRTLSDSSHPRDRAGKFARK